MKTLSNSILSYPFLIDKDGPVISSRYRWHLSFPYVRVICAYTHIQPRFIITIICEFEKKFLVFLLSIFLFFLPFHMLVFVADFNILTFSLLRTIRHMSLLKLLLSLLSDNMVISNWTKEEVECQSIFNLYLSLPIAYLSFPRYDLYWRNLYISIQILSHTRPWYT